jgi:hypothetical protein
LIRKAFLTAAIVCTALAARLQAQPRDINAFGVGASVGLVNDISVNQQFDGFHHSEVTGWLDYRFEKNSLLRVTYGNMRTKQTHSEETVDTPNGPLAMPLIKERVGYVTVGVSYLFDEGFFKAGFVGGIGGYGITPDTVAPPYDAFADRKETVFGWHFGSEAIFRAYKNVGIVLRLTYHNVAAHPHRQFVNADTGLVVRF